MKNIPKPLIYAGIAIIFVASIGITAILSKGSDNSEQYKKEIASLEADLEDAQAESAEKDARIKTCVTVMDGAVTGVAYYAFALNYLADYFETQDASKVTSAVEFKDKASEATNEYTVEQVNTCRDGD